MGFFSKIFDDVLGLDPGGGGIYKVARGVLGDKVADDILGMDPTGKGAIKAYNVAIPLIGGYYGAEALGAFGGGGGGPELLGEAGGYGAGGGGSFLSNIGGAGASKYLVPGAMVANALIGSSAARSAAGTQAQAQQRALDLQALQYQQQRADLQPFVSAGTGAQNRLLDLMGLSKNTGAEGFGKYTKDFSMSDFEADPGYSFRLSEGQKGLDRQAAARGGLISGGALKAATRFGQDMGSQEYMNAYNRYQTNRANQLAPLGSLVTSGQAAATNQAGAAGNYGIQAGQGMTNIGAANAAGTMASSNALGNALGQYLNYSSNQNIADAIRRSTYT
jgi:hypothetical protein